MSNKIIDAAKKYKELYGILGIVAVFAVVIKILSFYNLMGITSNFVIVSLITMLFVFLLFSGFKNKWVPAVIFALLSILMFADVTYNSFFNRYLSVGMIGAAEVVGEIGESIKQVMKQENFIMIIDAALIFVVLALKKRRTKKANASEKNTEAAGTESDDKSGEQSQPEFKEKAEQTEQVKKRPHRFIFLIVIAVLVTVFSVNITNASLLTSISNQEFLTFHIKDIVMALMPESQDENLSAWKDTYQDEKNGPLFGTCEGKNVIMIQIESFQDFVVQREYNGQEITPFLNSLIEGNATYFDNFYQQTGSGNTSDAEFAANNSIMGTITSYTYKLYNQNSFRGLPILLSERGYETAAFHAYEQKMFWSRALMYPSLGFDHFFGSIKGRGGAFEMTEWLGWGLSDSEFYPQAVDYMETLSEPFYSFVISLSNHHAFLMPDHYKFIELLPEDEGTMVGDYIQSAAYTDYALKVFFEELKEAGLYENTLFIMYGDHAGLVHDEENDKGMERLLGKPYDFEEMLKIPCIIYTPDENVDLHQTITTAGGQTDIFPTVAYLMGFEELDTIYLGNNLYNVSENLVAQQIWMIRGSYFTNDIAYEMSRDGVFENGRAWNIHTGEPVALDEQCYQWYLESLDVISTSEYVLSSDAIDKYFYQDEN